MSRAIIWNPWHGCTRLSEGCAHCYVYSIDASFSHDASVVTRTKEFDLPRRRKRDGSFVLESGQELFACLSSDFFLEKADEWRAEVWEMMRRRGDVRFSIITKRILRARQCLPADWGGGYPNVAIGCTAENQRRADERLGEFVRLPVSERFIVCEPLLGPVDVSRYLATGAIARVIAGGESGDRARPCHYEWVLSLQEQCMRAGVAFHFKQTGACFVKDGRLFRIPRREQLSQAQRAGIEYTPQGARSRWVPGENLYVAARQLSMNGPVFAPEENFGKNKPV